MDEDDFTDGVKRYLDLLRRWVEAGMPDEMTGILDHVWMHLPSPERVMAARLVAIYLRSEMRDEESK